MIKIIRINEQGFLMNDDFINNESELTNFTVMTPLPTDEDGRQLPFYKARWVNNKWIEGATQEEIEELIKPQPNIPTIEEQIASNLDYLLDVDYRLLMVELGMN